MWTLTCRTWRLPGSSPSQPRCAHERPSCNSRQSALPTRGNLPPMGAQLIPREVLRDITLCVEQARVRRLYQISSELSKQITQAAVMPEARKPCLGHARALLRLTPAMMTSLQGEKLALVGANGQGKSTLVKLMLGELRPKSGSAVQHPQARIGTFAQSNVEDLVQHRGHLTSLKHLKALFPDGEILRHESRPSCTALLSGMQPMLWRSPSSASA